MEPPSTVTTTIIDPLQGQVINQTRTPPNDDSGFLSLATFYIVDCYDTIR
jgi:hypothetical protein